MKVCKDHMKEKVLEELKRDLNVIDKIILNVFSSYTYKVYKNGIKKGFDW